MAIVVRDAETQSVLLESRIGMFDGLTSVWLWILQHAVPYADGVGVAECSAPTAT